MAIPISPPNGINPNPEAGPSSPKYQLSQTLTAHRRAVTALRFSNDGKTLLSAGADGWLHFWDPETGEHVRGFRAHKTGINDISISPDSLYIATASDDCTSLVYYLNPPPSTINFTSSGNDNTNELNEEEDVKDDSNGTGHTKENEPLRILKGHTAPVLSISFSPKSNLLVTGSFDESAIIWDLKKGKILKNLPAHADPIWCVNFDNEGAMVLTASLDGLIRLWDVSSGQCLKTLDNDTNSPVSFASFTPSPYFLLSSTLSSTLRIYNIHTSKVLKTIQSPNLYISEKFPCPSIIFAKPNLSSSSVDVVEDGDDANQEKMDIDVDGKNEDRNSKVTNHKDKQDAWIITGSENGKLIIWDLQSKSVIQVLQSHNSTVVAVAVHPSGRIIASGSLEPEKAIKLWRI
ncbi:uncharacterized protein L201_002124 [Kwoniella dendrophila CBS 6074]|uniref:WDR5-like beta-propeller domain-containing protein n=1 Tax=Kwoniella dendrophila CBS 6074 TaxID=1295534 RepID=A0AAX4JPB9_9TREE